MKVLCIAAMKGGVGKTSIVANLAVALSKKIGSAKVYVIDLDPQGAVQWHFGLVDHQARGLCVQSIEGGSLSDIFVSCVNDVICLPYGYAEEPERLAFEAMLAEQPDWLESQLGALELGENDWVLIDTPPGPSPYLPQAMASSDLVLAVLLPDAASYGTVPAMETYLDEMIPINPSLRSFYLLNQVDEDNSLGTDMIRTLRQHLVERLIPNSIKVDEALREALAVQQTVLAYDPHGQASHDINSLANWVLKTLA
jgi:cellulose synthase operon protein YhjQ